MLYLKWPLGLWFCIGCCQSLLYLPCTSDSHPCQKLLAANTCNFCLGFLGFCCFVLFFLFLAQRTCFSWASAGWKCWAVSITEAALNQLQIGIGRQRPQLPYPSSRIKLMYILPLSLRVPITHVVSRLAAHLLLSVFPSLSHPSLSCQCFQGFYLSNKPPEDPC